jgi:hypothetical protein
MQHRPEDTPKVVVLSAVILAVFGAFVWQRLHADALSASANPVRTPPPAAKTATVSGEPPVPGQMRYLDDAALESAPPPSNIEAHADAFRPLQDPSRARSIGPTRLTTNAPLPPLPGILFVRPVPIRNNTAPRTLSIVLDGVIGEGRDAEAWVTVRDPKSADPSLGERTVALHLGDLLGSRLVTGIGSEGMALYHAGWWPVGEERMVPADLTVIRFSHTAPVSGRQATLSGSAVPGVEPILPTVERGSQTKGMQTGGPQMDGPQTDGRQADGTQKEGSRQETGSDTGTKDNPDSSHERR